MKSTGLHHVSVLVSDAERAYDFYHQVLGMRLTLKTVNQDDTRMYHLFFGDQTGREGTEFTVFEMKDHRAHRFGSNGIERVFFYVPSRASLDYWEDRFNDHQVRHQGIETYNNQEVLTFQDADGMRLGLVVAPEDFQAHPYTQGEVPEAHAIGGIAWVQLRVQKPERSQKLIQDLFGFQVTDQSQWKDHPVTIMTIENDFHHQVHLVQDQETRRERLGVGGMHHLAFGVPDKSRLLEIQEYLNTTGKHNSGMISREFFTATYFREPNTILFEVSTPIQESKATETPQDLAFSDIPLMLPDFLEADRDEIQNNLN